MDVSVTDGQNELKPQSEHDRWLGTSGSDLALFAATTTFLFGGLLLFYGLRYPLHHDLAGSVLSGRLAVALGDSYREYSVYFPPAERVWYSLATRLSDLTGLRLDLAIVAMTGAMVMIGAGLAYRIRQATVGASPIFLVMSVALLVLLPILFKNVFGLREHIVALGLWPYLVLRVSDPGGTRIGWRMRATLGLWMGATLLLKYLYAIVVLLVEVTDAFVQRRPSLLFRTENLVAGGVVAVYLFCWLVLDSSQRTAIGAMFSAIDANLADPAANLAMVAQNLGYAAVFLAILIASQVPRRLMAIGLAVVIGSVIVAWSQERWYTHHLFPIILAYGLWWWTASGYFRWWSHAVVALGLSYPLISQSLSTLHYRKQVAEVDQALSERGQSVNGKRVGMLNMHPSPFNQYLASHGAIRWNPLMNNAYVAAELQSFDKKANATKLPPPVKLDDPGRWMLHDQMLRLWEDKPPDVMILDHSSSWPLRYIDVDWVHEFSKDPRFSAVLSHYRPVLTHKGKRVSFTYYVRAE